MSNTTQVLLGTFPLWPFIIFIIYAIWEWKRDEKYFKEKKRKEELKNFEDEIMERGAYKKQNHQVENMRSI